MVYSPLHPLLNAPGVGGGTSCSSLGAFSLCSIGSVVDVVRVVSVVSMERRVFVVTSMGSSIVSVFGRNYLGVEISLLDPVAKAFSPSITTGTPYHFWLCIAVANFSPSWPSTFFDG